MATAITSDNMGSAVNFAVFIPLIAMCLATLLKIATKVVKVRAVHLDDYLVAAAMLLGLAQGILVSREVPAGVGQHISKLTTAQIDELQQAQYGSQILYVAAIGAGRVSSLAFMLTLGRFKGHKIAILAIMGFVGLWVVVGILGLAFQCTAAAKGYWEIHSEQCFNQPAFWDFLEATAILTDFSMVCVLAYVVWDLQVSWAKKGLVLSAFGTRLIEIPIIILRLVYIQKLYHSDDPSYDAIPAVITTEVLLNVSIILASVPFMKTFIQQLSPGWYTGDIRTDVYGSGHVSYKLRDNAQSPSNLNSQTLWMGPGRSVTHAYASSINNGDDFRPGSDSSNKVMISQVRALTVENGQGR